MKEKRKKFPKLQQRKKYLTGTAVTNYMETPAEALEQNRADIAQAQHEAYSNPWHLGLNMLSGAIMDMGMGMVQQGGGIGQAFKDVGAAMKKGPTTGAPKMNKRGKIKARGGRVGNVPVEVEGEEVIETPQGKVAKIKGPSHENGGVDIDLPEDTMVYSKRLGVDKESFAKRKLKRENKIKRLEKALEANPNDSLIQNSMSRTVENNKKEEESDVKLQEFGAALDSLTNFAKKYAKGGRVKYQDAGRVRKKGRWEGDFAPTETGEDPYKLPFTFGDLTGMFGTAVSTFGPYLNTLSNRGQDTPHKNYYEGVGDEAIQTSQEAESNLKGIRDNAKRDLASKSRAERKSARNKFRSLNTVGAYESVVSAKEDIATRGIMDDFSKNMINILNKRGDTQFRSSLYEAKGKTDAVLADEQQRDNFNTNLGADIVNIGTGIQKFGSDFNTRQENEDFLEVLKERSAYDIGWKKVDGVWKQVGPTGGKEKNPTTPSTTSTPKAQNSPASAKGKRRDTDFSTSEEEMRMSPHKSDVVPQMTQKQIEDMLLLIGMSNKQNFM